MAFHYQSCFNKGKVIATANAFGLKHEPQNPVVLNVQHMMAEQIEEMVAWLREQDGESVWNCGIKATTTKFTDDRGLDHFELVVVTNDGKDCWSHFDFADAALAERFRIKFYGWLAHTGQWVEPAPTVTFERSDIPNVWNEYRKGKYVGQFYRDESLKVWFSDSPYDIVEKHLGLAIEPGKVRNLLSLASKRQDALWAYLSLATSYDAATVNEIVNVILGPLAATLKERDLPFESHGSVIEVAGMVELAKALSLGLIPDGARKALYPALISRFNVEFGELLRITAPTQEYDETYSSRDAARIAFYNILADVLEPIFSEASGDELNAMIKAVLDANPVQAAKVSEGDQKVIGWAMGQVMRASPTKLDPNTVRAAIIKYSGN